MALCVATTGTPGKTANMDPQNDPHLEAEFPLQTSGLQLIFLCTKNVAVSLPTAQASIQKQMEQATACFKETCPATLVEVSLRVCARNFG